MYELFMPTMLTDGSKWKKQNKTKPKKQTNFII